MPEQRRLRTWAYFAASILGGMAIATAPLVLVGRPMAHGAIDPARVVVWTIAAGLAMAWVVAFGVLLFRSQDEFERQASHVGWYWGAVLGLAISFPVFVFIEIGGLHWLWPNVPAGRDLGRAFMTGYYLPVVMQFAGFLIVRAWWRLSKR
jgi:hypothetical protein